MKSKFKHVSRITLALFLMSLFSGMVFCQAAGHESLTGMFSYAKAELPSILTLIPVDRESDYGFKNRDEFKTASLGIPYQEYDMDTELPTGYWRVPVTVAGENRALLRLIQVDGSWKFAGFGGAKLAGELAEYEQAVGKGLAATGRIIRDFNMHCDYVQYDAQPGKELGGQLYPLESAARMLLKSGIAATVGYEGIPLQKIRDLRAGLKKGPGEHNTGKTR